MIVTFFSTELRFMLNIYHQRFAVYVLFSLRYVCFLISEQKYHQAQQSVGRIIKSQVRPPSEVSIKFLLHSLPNKEFNWKDNTLFFIPHFSWTISCWSGQWVRYLSTQFPIYDRWHPEVIVHPYNKLYSSWSACVWNIISVSRSFVSM